MRSVQTRGRSFPEVPSDAPLDLSDQQVWQVLCGDEGHWRVGAFSPAATRAEQITELERHDCPELFCLLRGRLTLVVARDGRLQQIPLQPLRPVLVQAPHGGFCPDGPHQGVALVVERSSFDTEYREAAAWHAPR